MGLLSKLNPFKMVKNIFSSANRRLKKTKLGRIIRGLAIGAAIAYAVGFAAKAFAAPTDVMAGNVANLQTQGAAAGAPNLAATTGVTGGPATTAISTAPTAGGVSSAVNPIDTIRGAGPNLASASTPPTSGGLWNTVKSGGDKVKGFFGGSDLAKYGAINVGGQMLMGAMSPDPVEEQMRLDEERARRNRIAGFGGYAGGYKAGPIRVGNRTYG